MILIVCVDVWGLNTAVFNDALPIPGRTNATTPVVLGTPLGITVEATSFTRLFFDMPGADKQIQRTRPVVTPCQPGQSSTPQAPCVGPERVQFTLNWLSAAGTATVLAAILSGLFLRLSLSQWAEALGRTARRLRVPILVIGQVLGLASLTRYAGTDAILGLAFTVTGPLYPFFAAYLGWLGVFLTGSDTASNLLFGSLQRITAEQLNVNPILAAATNSTGGVMRKMIDAQSLTVATAACYEDAREGSNGLGPIFRRLLWFSVLGAAFIGVVALLQAYVFPGAIPPVRPA